jgi:DNA polymerase III subunit gamma/tau
MQIMAAAPRKKPVRPGAPAKPAPLALYRKYRPASFAEVKGQEHVTEPLRQALRNGRVHHAYLFSGPRGCGKTSSARILARSLNCEQGPTPDPCGVCASCVALAPSGPGSIDVIEIDAASHGGVDDARDLRERAFYAPVSGRFKIYIIDEAHMVTREGFNALLKLVEEPPPHLKFVFATTEPEKVIATIRSRTHHYPFRLVPPAVLRELLEEILRAEGVKYQPTVLPLVVRAGAGSVRDALSVLDQLLAGAGDEGLTYDHTVALLGYTDDSLLDEMVGAFTTGNGAAAFATVDRVVEGGHDPRRFAADLLDRLRDLIILAAVPGAGQTGLLDAPADRLERMAEQAGRFGQAELTRAAEILSDGLIQMRGTTSPRLLLELICAQVLLPAASTGEKALLARLERLERQLEAAPPGAGPAGRRAGPEPTGPGSRPDPAGREARPRPAGPAAAPSSADEAAGRPPRTPQTQEDTRRPAQSRESRDSHGPPPRSAAGPASPATHAPSRDAGGASAGPAHGRPASNPPATEAPQAGPGPRASAGPVDADLLRQRWPEILDAVRGKRKVAWMLLNSATVQSLEGRVLTVAFPSEGNAKGFAGSGHDQVLTGVLTAMLGLNVQVRAVAGASPGAASPHAEPAPPEPAPPEPVRSEPARPDGPGYRPPPAPESGPATSPAARQQAAQRARPHGGQPSRPAAPVAEEEWPDDATGPGGTGAEDLSGMELIRRQLGGRVIEEIEDV